MILKTKPIITAHSGCEGTEIDTLESIDRALELGAEAIEVDVRVSPDGTPRISHNALSAGEYQRKITLDDVLDRIEGTALLVNFDLKEPEALYKTLEAAEARGLSPERLIFSGCTDPDQLLRDQRLTLRGQFFLNIEEVLKFVYLRREHDFDLDRFGQLMAEPWSVLKEHELIIPDQYIDDTVRIYQTVHAAAANLPKTLLGAPLLAALQAAGIPLSVWTVNEPELVERCLRTGVRNITTRQVRQAITIREAFA